MAARYTVLSKKKLAAEAEKFYYRNLEHYVRLDEIEEGNYFINFEVKVVVMYVKIDRWLCAVMREEVLYKREEAFRCEKDFKCMSVYDESNLLLRGKKYYCMVAFCEMMDEMHEEIVRDMPHLPFAAIFFEIHNEERVKLLDNKEMRVRNLTPMILPLVSGVKTTDDEEDEEDGGDDGEGWKTD